MNKKNNESPVIVSNVDRMIKYCTGVADEFLARLDRIRYFVAHNLTSGTAHEMILRDFLASFSTGRFGVGQGFICDPTIPDHLTEYRVSKQCDIIVYNRDYPLIHSEGEVKVVWPQSVKLFIEVKTKLNKKEMVNALDNICSAKYVPYMRLTDGLIFAFKSSKVQTIIKHLQQYPNLSIENAPSAILLLDKGVIIHRWTPVEGEISDTYEVRAGNNGEKAIVMAFLLMFFFNILMGSSWGGSGIANMLRRMLEGRTKKISEDFIIGDSRQVPA